MTLTLIIIIIGLAGILAWSWLKPETLPMWESKLAFLWAGIVSAADAASQALTAVPWQGVFPDAWTPYLMILMIIMMTVARMRRETE